MDTLTQNPFLIWLALSAVVGGLAWAFLRKELRVKGALYSAFLIACAVALLASGIRRGLDLKGGMYLVMKVETSDAFRATTSDSVTLAINELGRAGMPTARVTATGVDSFTVDGVEAARVKDARTTLKDFFRSADWTLVEGSAPQFALTMTDFYRRGLSEQTVRESIRTLERRVNQLGVAEPVIAQHGAAGDQILIQLPGVTDQAQAKRMITTTAQLELRLVENVASSREMLLPAGQSEPAQGTEILSGPGAEPGRPNFYLVRAEPVITGRDLKNARPGVDPQTNLPDVQFSLKPEAAEKFGRFTSENVGRQLAIVLDRSVESAPSINSRITDEGVIQGNFSQAEADELAKVLRAGALPATLRYLQEQTVGASLGQDAIAAGTMASIASMAFIAIFMLVYYRFSGVNAVVALLANVLILMGAMAYYGATLTLPGIAGIILTIGVGVDTNVLVFERIREELRAGKTVKSAVNNGFERVWITILDTHATALIAAAFLFQFGTGAIQGFAVTLVWGLIANVFASYFVSKFLFEWVLGGEQKVETLSI